MKRLIALMCCLSAVSLAGLVGCNQAKSPEHVQKDVNDAAASGSRGVTKAEEREAKTEAEQERNVARSVDQANTRVAGAAVDTAVAEAEAESKVALAKCEALAGEQQRACRDQANANLEAARARAKTLKSE